VRIRERSGPSAASLVSRHLRAHSSWFAYVATALCCTAYVDFRAQFIPKWGEWYSGDAQPYVFLQVRSWLSGRLAVLPHPAVAGHDYVWGRSGMHTAWGLGVPLLATPFHVLGRMFGAPGFPDHVRFLIFFAITTVVFARALHVGSPKEPSALGASCAAAGFMMVFPTFVGLLVSRFLIYEQAIATGALWNVILLSGVLALQHRCTPLRLALVCGAAPFSLVLRPPLAVYGLTTIVLVVIIAHRKGLRARTLIAGAGAAGVGTAFYLVGNFVRFGSPLNAGYANLISGAFVNRLTRWGLSFSKVPFTVAAKELYATLFRLDPVASQIMMGTPPPAVRPYVEGERWREYYSPTYDRFVLAGLVLALGIVCWRVVHRRLWRAGDLAEERATIVGAWALPPAIVLFVFYARVGNLVTRYLVDMYPAFAAASMCVGMAVVDWFRKRTPALAPSAQLAIAGACGLYIATWTGWASNLSHPIDRETLLAKVAEIDAHAGERPPVPGHFKCGEPRGPQPVHTHLEDWMSDCSFHSGMVFAMPHAYCVSFTFRSKTATWGPEENESLSGFRATGDFDPLVSCGAPTADGDDRRITMCDPHRPPFLLDGMRLYAIASLDEKLNAIDRLKLMRIDSSTSCK
jgi:hypothetical protein